MSLGHYITKLICISISIASLNLKGIQTKGTFINDVTQVGGEGVWDCVKQAHLTLCMGGGGQ